MKENIENVVVDIIDKNTLVKINDKVYLKKYQIEVLDYYHIPYRNVATISEILFLIDEVLDSDDLDDYEGLEEVALSLQEFNYYHNTNK